MFAVPRTADFLVLSGFVAMLLIYIVDNKSSFKFCSVFAALMVVDFYVVTCQQSSLNILF